MRVRFLSGPAGCGKTFRCLTEARNALSSHQDGSPLVLVAPKQTTYQLERQFLEHPSIQGYTRFHILSFERLAYFIFQRLGKTQPNMLDEEGRLMVLRGLLTRKRDELKLFRASARLTGFAGQLSSLIRELQRNQQTPDSLLRPAAQFKDNQGLAGKLHDLALLFAEYQDWLNVHELQDADCLLSAASNCLKEFLQAPSIPASQFSGASSGLNIENLWVDGFAELSEQELALLAALLPCCRQATVTFCLDGAGSQQTSWLSSWSVVRRAFEDCKRRLGEVPGSTLEFESLERDQTGRFSGNPVLYHLEKHWAAPQPYAPAAPELIEQRLRLAACVDPESEATLAAREIWHHVRNGGRFREVMVLVRKLDDYHEALQRVFARYEIPFFLDRRQSVCHHPLAELTRSALRLLSRKWVGDDWFAALKTGLVPVSENEIDRLENEALARGWKGPLWQKPLVVEDDPNLTAWLAKMQRRLLPPFQKLELSLASQQSRVNGPQLAQALRQFWDSLRIEQQLQEWAAGEKGPGQSHLPDSVHATVWEQMNAWADNIELGFPNDPLLLREWLPVLEAGLSNLTVGVIPPALDQVLIGSIDRSRNPEIRLALVLGMNETLFPSRPAPNLLLTETDRQELERRNVLPGSTARPHLAREHFYAYIACTRARERLVLSYALQDIDGAVLNPSPFLAHLQQLFPSLHKEVVPKSLDWREAEHAVELIAPVLKGGGETAITEATTQPNILKPSLALLSSLPPLLPLVSRLQQLAQPQFEDSLAPEMVRRLYGSVLRTSVSRMEQYAACPFKFFVHSGLRAEERVAFELDVKEQGNFQHDVLALFHDSLRAENIQWRALTPPEARARVGKLASTLMATFHDGLLQASEQSRFTARVLTESLQDFVETLVGWMRGQYLFEPVEVELPFGQDGSSPAWHISIEPVPAPESKRDGWPKHGHAQGELGLDFAQSLVESTAGETPLPPNTHRLEIYGRIDRVDLFREPDSEAAFCVVIDYKSSQKKLDAVLVKHGLQLQLLTYLNVLRFWPNPGERFGVKRLVPSGVFYVNLRGDYASEKTRTEALSRPEEARKKAYRHFGRFDNQVLRMLDSREDARDGDQFGYRLTNDGEIYKNSREALGSGEFKALLDSVQENFRRMGHEVFSGVVKVDPFRKGTMTACQQCGYCSICRIDPWTHRYRLLKD